MLHINRLTNLDCDCIIDYSWEDETLGAQFTHVASVQNCAAHAGIEGQAHTDVIHRESYSRAVTFNHLFEHLPDRHKQITDGWHNPKGHVTVRHEWEDTKPHRTLHVWFDGADLTPSEKASLNNSLVLLNVKNSARVH